ncbi:MAG TPA: metallophosphoesterase family protein [Verrucomicrobiae bacterium]
MKIGLISDTHGYLDPRVPEIFEGVEHILHAGDIGYASIILELERIAPVTAVLGNNDFGMEYRETEVVELGGCKFLIHHIVEPRRLTDSLKSRIKHAAPQVVMFGHTHKMFNDVIDGVHFLNPGYSGKQRFKLERSVAILHLEEGERRVEFVVL